MRGSKMRWMRVALILFVLPLAGCDLSWVKLTISDFESKRVQGIWISRQSEATGAWVHDVRIDFGAVALVQGYEWLQYESVVGAAGERNWISALVERAPNNSNEVTISLGFMRLSAPGRYKISAFNVAGESPLSDAWKAL